MTAGTVVITGGILATVILLCIIAVLCYCRLQVLGGWGRAGARAGLDAGVKRTALARFPVWVAVTTLPRALPVLGLRGSGP